MRVDDDPQWSTASFCIAPWGETCASNRRTMNRPLAPEKWMNHAVARRALRHR